MNYIVSKERLLKLLKAENELNVLEGDGVDNWTWYMEGRRQYLKEGAEMYGVNIDDNEDFDFEDLAELDLQNFEEI
ncbi:hypothetical protein [Dialister succinatiphilus]|uniref:hypothetical protein n=1 Tax=Dialister succinatiphilus TaxID=487173 RepID=UPI0040275491